MKLKVKIFIILFAVSALAMANNPPVGGGTCPGEYDSCESCNEETGEMETITFPAASPMPSSCISSFNMSIGIGFARIQRDGNFLNYSRLGFLSGQAGRGYYRKFDQVRKEILDIHNVTNRRVQFLNIIHDRIDSRLYSPSALSFIPLTNAEYIEQAGQLRQVRTESMFTNIETFNGGYSVKIWPITQLANFNKTNNLYTSPNAQPTTEIRFENPDFPLENNRLVISNKVSGREYTTLYDQSDYNRLTTKTYSGLDTSGDLLEELEVIFSNRGVRIWDYTIEKIRKRTDIVNGQYGPLKVIAHSKQTFRDFSTSAEGGDQNGKRLTQLIIAPNSNNPQITEYDYYIDPENKYINGRLKSQRNPDGSWEYWEYSDSPTSVVAVETRYTPWKDSLISDFRSGLKQETTLTPTETNRVMSVNGVVIGKQRYSSLQDPTSMPIEVFEEAVDEAECMDCEVVGFWHTHPRKVPRQGATDIERSQVAMANARSDTFSLRDAGFAGRPGGDNVEFTPGYVPSNPTGEEKPLGLCGAAGNVRVYIPGVSELSGSRADLTSRGTTVGRWFQ